MLKPCIRCGEQKPEDEFPPYKTIKSYENYKNMCLVCYRQEFAKKRNSPKGQAYMRVYARKRYYKFRHKNLARSAVSAAVKKGRLIKPLACENCKQELPLQGHHEDYDKPLEVMWLCMLCHKHLHGRLMDKHLIKQTKGKL